MKVREEPDDSKSKDEGLGDTTESRTDNLSKSDTHEEVSEITLDNTSTHRLAISYPASPCHKKIGPQYYEPLSRTRV